MEAEQRTIGHEVQDASIRGTLYAGLGLAVGIIVAGLIVLAIFHYLAGQKTRAENVAGMADTEMRQPPPSPRLEDHPAIELQELRTQEDLLLSTYGWTDKKAGLVRIPIERAMQLQMERGFPVRKEGSK
ncbi:hypothetical protein [Bryobacter aggregatus]|uniref:hypothetical protein n=1 Tax=Bryobacter aggregatus TaxID=360054 RepID=UPI0004E1B136|nr:hypothetical protein [Bryobacter aggregatus]